MARFGNWAPGGNFALLGNGSDLAAARSHQRRIMAFAGVFLPTLVASLTYLFTLAPEYRAAARLEITPASVAPRPDDVVPMANSASQSFLTEVQILTSRPLLETAVAQLKREGLLPEDLGADPVDSAQHMLSTEAVDGTKIVQLQADGTKPDFLPLLVNKVVDAYRRRLEETYKNLAANADADLTEELRLLDDKVATKRAAVDSFRARNDIVSLERDENEALTRLKGLGTALNEANDRVANAEGRLKALRDSERAVVRLKDNPNLAGMESRAAQMRQDLKELGRKYTPQYLDLDPDVKALRARLADTEQQIQSERVSSQQTAVSEAQQELAAARETVVRLTQQLSEEKQRAQEFTGRFGEYKALQDDLNQLEDLHRSALGRLAKLEAQERESAPRMTILEPAAVPQEPRRPLYALGIGLSLAGSLILGFFAVWFVEFFAPRPPVEPTVILREPSWGALPVPQAPTSPEPPFLAANGAPLNLPAPETLPETGPRELSDSEITTLLRAANDDTKLAIVALLMGIGPEELILLRWDAIDPVAGHINIPGDSARTMKLESPLRHHLATRIVAQSGSPRTLLQRPNGAQLAVADLENLVLSAAYDAMLDRAEEVTSKALRHTYIVYLLRQGIRLADIGRIVGRIPPDELVVYMRLGSPETRLPLDRIERILPALRNADASAGSPG